MNASSVTRNTDFDTAVRLAVYQGVLADGHPPSLAAIASGLGVVQGAVADALRRLHDARMLVLHPGTVDVWMAMPFSAVPTPFRVETAIAHGVASAWWANCAWDALGIPALLHGARIDVGATTIRTVCADCNEPLAVTVSSDGKRVEPSAAWSVVHFALPPTQWWDDVGFT